MKKLLFIFTVFTVFFALSACGQLDDKDQTLDEGVTYTSIDINPSIEVLVDDDGVVISIAYLNEDAEVVAADLDLVGLPFEDALEIYINAAIETGYIDVDSNENIVTITSSDEALEASVKANVEAILTEQGVGAAIFGGAMNEEYVALAETHEISVGRARLISRAVEIDEVLTIDAALELSHQEIMEILVAAHRDHMEAFVADRQAAAEAMKTEMETEAMERVNTHRDAVESGEIEVPDYDAIRGDVEANLAEVRTRYESRIAATRQAAQERKDTYFPDQNTYQ